MNYDYSFLNEAALEEGFIQDTFEKVSRLTEVLSIVSNDEFLSERLALKGGTAINLAFFKLPRLSVDIDFDYTQNNRRDEMLSERELITSKLNSIMEKLGYNIKLDKEKNVHALCSNYYTYQKASGGIDNLKIETNYMLRNHILGIKSYETKELKGINKVKINCVHPIEIFGTKITALLTRGAARDLYDIKNMVNIWDRYSTEQKDMLRKCTIFYMVLNSDKPFENFDISNIDLIKLQKIRTDLLPVLNRSERKKGGFDLTETQSMVKEALSDFLQMTEKEKAFVQSFFDCQYRPELLFEDESIIEFDPQKAISRVQNHPMVNWKQQKIAEHKNEIAPPTLQPQKQPVNTAVKSKGSFGENLPGFANKIHSENAAKSQQQVNSAPKPTDDGSKH